MLKVMKKEMKDIWRNRMEKKGEKEIMRVKI